MASLEVRSRPLTAAYRERVKQFVGYLGLVLFLGGTALRLLEPGTPVGGSSGSRAVATLAAVIGFAMVVARLGDLAANSDQLRERVLARIVLVGTFMVFFGLAFLGVALLLSTPGTA